MAELRPHLLKVKRQGRKPLTRQCVLPGCYKLITDGNRSGVCTHCWHNRPDETAAVWALINGSKVVHKDSEMVAE